MPQPDKRNIASKSHQHCDRKFLGCTLLHCVHDPLLTQCVLRFPIVLGEEVHDLGLLNAMLRYEAENLVEGRIQFLHPLGFSLALLREC